RGGPPSDQPAGRGSNDARPRFVFDARHQRRAAHPPSALGDGVLRCVARRPGTVPGELTSGAALPHHDNQEEICMRDRSSDSPLRGVSSIVSALARVLLAFGLLLGPRLPVQGQASVPVVTYKIVTASERGTYIQIGRDLA